MSTISSIASSASASATASIDQQTLAALQIQLSIYFQALDSQNVQVKAAYQELQSAVSSGDLSQAQASFAVLQRVWQPPNAASQSNPSAQNNSPQTGSGLNVVT